MCVDIRSALAAPLEDRKQFHLEGVVVLVAAATEGKTLPWQLLLRRWVGGDTAVLADRRKPRCVFYYCDYYQQTNGRHVPDVKDHLKRKHTHTQTHTHTHASSRFRL